VRAHEALDLVDPGGIDARRDIDEDQQRKYRSAAGSFRFAFREQRSNAAERRPDDGGASLERLASASATAVASAAKSANA